MDTVLRALAIYTVVFILFRANGKRTLAQITTFDFVLVLIVGESVQQGLVGDDFSLTTSFLLIVTLVAVDTSLTVLQHRWARLDRLLEGAPLILVDDGNPLHERLLRSRVSLGEIMAAAREKQGLENLKQVKYAVLECNGSISIVPRR